MHELKTILAIVCPAVLGAAAISASTLHPAPGPTQPPIAPMASVAAAPVAPVAVAASPPATDPNVDARTAWTLDLMSSWPHAATQVPTADYASVARDIAVASDSSDDAAMLAGLAYWEGARYARTVDEQFCNDPAWRHTAEGRRSMHITGDCDGGYARSLWQIHPIVDRASRLFDACNVEAVTRSRLDAARCALAISRSSMQATGDLSGYSGEPTWNHPKADLRLTFIRRAIAKHPFKLPAE